MQKNAKGSILRQLQPTNMRQKSRLVVEIIILCIEDLI